MTTTDALLERVRAADPVADVDLRQWSGSEDARRLFDHIVGTNVVALRSPRRHRARWIGGAAVVTTALATAAAASGILGGAAPESIRAHLAAVDTGLPEDLRANPDVENAMAVASTAAGVLYAADAKGGGYCSEIVTEGDRPRGAVCVTAAEFGDTAIDFTAPIPADDQAPLLVAGRINDALVERIVASYPNGTDQDIALGIAGYWLLEVQDDARAAALSAGLEIVFLGGDGHDVATITVGPLRDDDPEGTAHDVAQPLSAWRTSAEGDLTLVLALEGSVDVAAATTLEVRYPDSTGTAVAFAADGTYRFELPAERQDDFAAAWGQMVARDASGAIVASVPFTSVANEMREP